MPSPTAASTKRWPTIPLPMTRIGSMSDPHQSLVGRTQVDGPGDEEADDEEPAEDAVGHVAGPVAEERLAQGEVDGDTAHRPDGAGDADQRPRRAPGGAVTRVRFGARPDGQD